MKSRHRRIITQTAGMALAAIAMTSVSAPHNAASAAASSSPIRFLAAGVLGGTTLQANGKLLQVPKTDDDGLDPLIHHHYP